MISVNRHASSHCKSAQKTRVFLELMIDSALCRNIACLQCDAFLHMVWVKHANLLPLPALTQVVQYDYERSFSQFYSTECTFL
jgi:hypothetical protein